MKVEEVEEVAVEGNADTAAEDMVVASAHTAAGKPAASVDQRTSGRDRVVRVDVDSRNVFDAPDLCYFV